MVEISEVIPVFVGYDPRQPASFTALSQSIITRTSLPVAITPIVLSTLPVQRKGLTPFTYSRFLVPWLSKYRGWAIFMDIDMLLRGDLAELWALRDDNYAVMAVDTVLAFERASMMLMNCGALHQLTPDYVAQADNMHALRFTDQIGVLPPEWNFLVGYDDPAKADIAKLLHYTQGVPYYPETADSYLADDWRKMLERGMSSATWSALMGTSVHAKPVLERLQHEKDHRHEEQQNRTGHGGH